MFVDAFGPFHQFFLRAASAAHHARSHGHQSEHLRDLVGNADFAVRALLADAAGDHAGQAPTGHGACGPTPPAQRALDVLAAAADGNPAELQVRLRGAVLALDDEAVGELAAHLGA